MKKKGEGGAPGPSLQGDKSFFASRFAGAVSCSLFKNPDTEHPQAAGRLCLYFGRINVAQS
ncbi:hypothetical protein CW354_02850 [Marinicaulis flavus]|uniref:Uncharacterized protein n=1 Tax=Hyphococcus luteus TaxID=2058213 RepID=A0A2S7K8V6_9PROT|nr:hypothetical protein CW354_02850 [Marinicaulis flavus]